ncbi:MAG: DEAD/DEAH box helicase family protein [Deltaproteobacteria bacterium]|nr:DEAD/DEAH box helicase family protein [Deltaproteobacteria bacterium]
MPEAIISYDKDLPEIPDREPHSPPTAYLRKKKKDEFEIVQERRPSKLLLIKKLRDVVEEWRNDGYPGASNISQRLFTFWFEEDHLVGDKPFRYYFGQREAIETLVYLYEIEKNRDAKKLIDAYGEIFYPEGTQLRLTSMGITHQTSMDGKRQIRRYIPEVESETVQDLPAENLRRYAFKMATGSGKTVVMAMVMVWSYFHRKTVDGSDLSTNFLLLAPNIIVYQRLEKDFANNQIFYEFPLIPPEWKSQWNMKVILRGQTTEPDPSGNLFLTNIQQIYESRQVEWTPTTAIDALLGKKPVKDLASYERPLLERLQNLRDLVVFNDEAHHVHDEELEWHKTLMNLHQVLPSGLALWLDFSATPKDQNGTYFPWIICDYPLAQAVEDRIVKAPLIVHQVRKEDPDKVTRKNVIEAYGDWLLAAISRWKEHYGTYKGYGQRPVLFIMAEQNNLADEIGDWLISAKETGLKKNEVLVIHTDKEGEITKKDLEKAREAARDIDKPGNRIKVIVSVLMLREGWDVRNVTIVLGLRPFTSKAKILPEQAVGRGLRLMKGISPDRTQTLEVMGTERLQPRLSRLSVWSLCWKKANLTSQFRSHSPYTPAITNDYQILMPILWTLFTIRVSWTNR